jgi:Autotransporter beta-domain
MQSRSAATIILLGTLATAGTANAGCEVVPATQQASTAASANTAGLIASRVTSVVTNSGGGTGAGSTGGGASPGGGTSPGGSLNAAGGTCGTTSVPDATLSEDETISRQSSGAARDGSKKINSVWAASSITWLKKTDRNGDYGGTISNGIVGYDRRLTESLIGGVALGYEKVLINTKYVANGGSVEGDTVSVSPYVGYSINDWLVADGVAGYARVT